VARMGLNSQATHDVNALIATGNQAVATLTWVSAVVLVLGGIGMASTLSTWYHRIYGRTPPRGFLRHLAYQAAGVVAFTFYISFEVWVFDEVRPVGGRGLVFVLTFVFAVLFGGGRPTCSCIARSRCADCPPPDSQPEPAPRVLESSRRSRFPARSRKAREARAPAGVVIALITFLVGFGVCLHAGAVFGRMWNEWQDERASPEADRVTSA
jgi:hypothetical protein